MTREEAIQKAINIVVYFEAHFAKSKEAREEAANIIEALEQEQDILDKIRAEIERKAKDYDKFDDYSSVRGLRIALGIIDKYKEGGTE